MAQPIPTKHAAYCTAEAAGFATFLSGPINGDKWSTCVALSANALPSPILPVGCRKHLVQSKHSKSEHFHSKAAPKCEKLKYSSKFRVWVGFCTVICRLKKHLSLLIYPLNISKHHLHTCLNSQSKYFTGTCDPGGLCWRSKGAWCFERLRVREIWYQDILSHYPQSNFTTGTASRKHRRTLTPPHFLHCLPRTISTNCSLSSYHEDS